MPKEFPGWLEPMAATLTQERFTDPGWIFERKYDGIRLLAFRQDATVDLYSRARNPQHMPALAEAIARLPVRDVILDGEITWDRSGAYHVFDILWIDGRDLTSLPLDERRTILAALPLAPPLQRVEAIDHPAPWDLACAEGWEGVIAKRRDAPYEHRRSKHWLKMKCEVSHDFVVGGFTEPLGTRVGLGALLVGYFDGADFVYAGKVGTGFDRALLLDLRRRLEAAEVDAPPFTQATGLPRVRAHWVRPEIVVRVAFIEWTVHEKLRHSRLLSVLAGRDPRDVIRKAP
ncbi:Multifunctional non-homologous end joining protein LigD [Planctomycetaceae bacterium]|nr:Multifunctional non-homologous end joining protein LigD [Planctomycetaceae bacterium]